MKKLLFIFFAFSVFYAQNRTEKKEIVLRNKFFKKGFCRIYVVGERIYVISSSSRKTRFFCYDLQGKLLYFLEKDIKIKEENLPLDIFYSYGERKGKFWLIGGIFLEIDFRKEKVFWRNLPVNFYSLRALNPFINDSLIILVNYYEGLEKESFGVAGKEVFSVFDLRRGKIIAKFGKYPEPLKKIAYQFVGGIPCYVDTLEERIFVQYLTHPRLCSYSLKNFKEEEIRLLLPDYAWLFVGVDSSMFYFRRIISNKKEWRFVLVGVSKQGGEILESREFSFPGKYSSVIRFYFSKKEKYVQSYKTARRSKEEIRVKLLRVYF